MADHSPKLYTYYVQLKWNNYIRFKVVHLQIRHLEVIIATKHYSNFMIGLLKNYKAMFFRLVYNWDIKVVQNDFLAQQNVI